MNPDSIKGKHNGGPAFPIHDVQSAMPRTTDELIACARGMTLRDYFAAKAMVSLCSMNATGAQTIRDNDHLAEQAYAMADAMLKARSA